jgi:hypothetical protein
MRPGIDRAVEFIQEGAPSRSVHDTVRYCMPRSCLTKATLCDGYVTVLFPVGVGVRAVSNLSVVLWTVTSFQQRRVFCNNPLAGPALSTSMLVIAPQRLKPLGLAIAPGCSLTVHTTCSRRRRVDSPHGFTSFCSSYRFRHHYWGFGFTWHDMGASFWYVIGGVGWGDGCYWMILKVS